MKVIMLTGFGGPSSFQVQTHADLTPEAVTKGKVLVRVHAAGLNFAEIMARQGMYQNCPKTPCILGYECAGVVEAVGEGVTKVSKGSRVVVLTNFGAWAEQVIVDDFQAFPIPDSMSFEVAAAIPVTYLTAYIMLFNMGNLRQDQKLLVHMAAGGVGIAATQLARTIPNVTVIGTASASKHDAIRANGVDHPIDYRTLDYVAEVNRITENKGVDLVLDPLGGPDFLKNYNLLRPLGRHISFGGANFLSGQSRNFFKIASEWWGWKSVHPTQLMRDNRMIGGFFAGALISEKELILDSMTQLLQLYSEGKVNPIIDSVHSFEDIGAAVDRIVSRQNVGKVVLVPNKN